MMAALLGLPGLADEQPSVRVKGDRVNLRGRPDANGEVVGQVAANEELKVLQNGETWVGVAPPSGIRCWIHKDFVQDGRVSVKELSVRAGASINYPRIGSLFRGDPVTPRETFGEWLCVAPPTNAVVWVHRELLDVPALARAAEEAAAMPPPEAAVVVRDEAPAVLATNAAAEKIRPSAPEKPSVPSGTPLTHQAVVMPPGSQAGTATNAAAQPPSDLNLVPLPGQGSVAQHEGYVKPSPYLFAPGKYRLARKKGNTLETVCFLRGNSKQLAELADQYLLMQGSEYWVQGVREPVLVIDRIERRPEPESPP